MAAVPLSSDTLRRRIVRTLSEKRDSDVALGDLRLRVLPSLCADGTDLRVRRRGMADYPPLISIKSFHVDASLIGLWRKHVDRVQLDGFDIDIPPSQARDKQKALDRTDNAPLSTPNAQPPHDPLRDSGVVIDRVDADNARVVILPFTEDREPKVWAIHHLLMRDVGSTRPWPFEAALTNGVPPGEIDVSGTLSAHGGFGGTLALLEARGETDTPDFTIMVGGHPFSTPSTPCSTYGVRQGLNDLGSTAVESASTAIVPGLDVPRGRAAAAVRRSAPQKRPQSRQRHGLPAVARVFASFWSRWHGLAHHSCTGLRVSDVFACAHVGGTAKRPKPSMCRTEHTSGSLRGQYGSDDCRVDLGTEGGPFNVCSEKEINHGKRQIG